MRDGLSGRGKSLSVDPLLMRGDYVTRPPIDQNRKSTNATPTAKAGSRGAWSRDDDNALPVTVSGGRRLRRSRRRPEVDSDDDETASVGSWRVYWRPPTRSLSTGDCATTAGAAAASAPNRHDDSSDRHRGPFPHCNATNQSTNPGGV